jgi:hypothetical protein
VWTVGANVGTQGAQPILIFTDERLLIEEIINILDERFNVATRTAFSGAR